jgi:hypothetical protein
MRDASRFSASARTSPVNIDLGLEEMLLPSGD